MKIEDCKDQECVCRDCDNKKCENIGCNWCDEKGSLVLLYCEDRIVPEKNTL